MNSTEFEKFKIATDKEKFKQFYQTNGFDKTRETFNLSHGNLKALVKEWDLYLSQAQRDNIKKATWAAKETSEENQLKAYTARITAADIVQYYITENHSVEDCVKHFEIASHHWFIKIINFYNIHKEYSDRVKLTAQTKEEKYGSPTYNNREKAKATCVEKFGVDNVFKDTTKMTEAYQSKLGVSHPMQVPEIKAKSVEHHDYVEGFNKAKQTFKDKTGYTNPGSTPECQAKMRQTNIEKYGVPYPLQNNQIRSKQAISAQSTSLEKRVSEFLSNNKFDYQAQYTIAKNEMVHAFDFAVYKDGELNILIDCDGLYYHGYLTDQNGKTVNNYTDDYRELLVPENVKFLIVLEGQEEDGYKELFRLLDMNYDEYISDIFDWCQNNGFPYPTFDDKILNNSFQSLCNTTSDKFKPTARYGEKIIQHFHHSIWLANKQGKLSPYEAWNDTELLKQCIRNRIIYKGNNLSPDRVLAGLSYSGIAPKVSVFNPNLAKYLIEKYLNKYDTIFDPFSGFSGRLLGTCTANKKYIGQDINHKSVIESNKIIQYFQLNAEITEQDSLLTTGKYDCLFTCSPYNDKENWGQPIENLSCDEWIDKCLSNYDCKEYLFVVDKTEKYKDFIMETLENKSHLNKSNEYVIHIVK